VNIGSAVRSAVQRGLGIGQLPEVIGAPAVAQGQLLRVLERWQPEAMPVYAVYPSNRYLTPKVRAFVELAMQSFPGRSGAG